MPRTALARPIVLARLALATGIALSASATLATEPAGTNILRNPGGGYTHRTVEIPPGSRILYISGQTATDEQGRTPPDAATQAEIVYQKILRSLSDAGMGPQAGTLVYVKALALPEVRVEIEAVAARLP